jgi:hypothetical protein
MRDTEVRGKRRGNHKIVTHASLVFLAVKPCLLNGKEHCYDVAGLDDFVLYVVQ